MHPPQSEKVRSSNVYLLAFVALMAFQLGVVAGMWVQRAFFTVPISCPNDQVQPTKGGENKP